METKLVLIDSDMYSTIQVNFTNIYFSSIMFSHPQSQCNTALDSKQDTFAGSIIVSLCNVDCKNLNL
jgi:hypothetical protein